MAKHRREYGARVSPFVISELEDQRDYEGRHHISDEDDVEEDNPCHRLIENSYGTWRDPVE